MSRLKEIPQDREGEGDGAGTATLPMLGHLGRTAKNSKDKIPPDKLWLPLDAGSVHTGQGLEQPDPVEDVPVHIRELELGNLQDPSNPNCL